LVKIPVSWLEMERGTDLSLRGGIKCFRGKKKASAKDLYLLEKVVDV
jgi:hypothetical protein